MAFNPSYFSSQVLYVVLLPSCCFHMSAVWSGMTQRFRLR